MQLSVVIPYYNRKRLLLNVLKSINPDYPIEVVIVDDGSSAEHQLDDILNNYKFKIRLIKLEPKTKWRGPTIAYNAGFKEATGDVILINSSECVHVGDIIGYVINNFKLDDYMAFSARMGMDYTTIEFNNPEELKKEVQGKGGWWGIHSTMGNFIPYCAAISKDNMDTLGGYDLRFVEGVGYDDYDFTHRVGTLGLKMLAIDNPFCFHQWHIPTEYPNTKNLDLLNYLNIHDPKRIKANG